MRTTSPRTRAATTAPATSAARSRAAAGKESIASAGQYGKADEEFEDAMEAGGERVDDLVPSGARALLASTPRQRISDDEDAPVGDDGPLGGDDGTGAPGEADDYPDQSRRPAGAAIAEEAQAASAAARKRRLARAAALPPSSTRERHAAARAPHPLPRLAQRLVERASP